MGIAVGWQRPQPLAAQVRVAGIIIRHSCLNGECPCRVYLHVPAEPSAATPGFQPGNSAFERLRATRLYSAQSLKNTESRYPYFVRSTRTAHTPITEYRSRRDPAPPLGRLEGSRRELTTRRAGVN